MAKKRAQGATVEAIAEELNVSLATARRFITNLAPAHDVEAGKYDKAWKPGTEEVVSPVASVEMDMGRLLLAAKCLSTQWRASNLTGLPPKVMDDPSCDALSRCHIPREGRSQFGRDVG